MPERALLVGELAVERVAELLFEVVEDEARVADRGALVDDERDLLRRCRPRIAERRGVRDARHTEVRL